MATDSEALMREGIAAARATFADFLDEMGWTAGDIQKTFCHQVGRAHQRLLFESLGLDPRDRLFHVRVSRQHGLGGLADGRRDRASRAATCGKATAWRCWASARAST